MSGNSRKVQLTPRVIGKRYVVKVNDQPVFTSPVRREALNYLRNIVINESITNVKLVNETVSEKVLQNLIPQTNVTTLVAAELLSVR